MSFSIPILQLRNKSALVYYQFQHTGPKKKSESRIANLGEQRKKAYSGNLSAGAKKRLAKATTLLVQCAKKRWLYNEVSKKNVLHQLSFITLTVSDPTKKLTGKEAYEKLLSHFLAWLRRTKGANTYIWKAELQKNEQIHYHITTPAFINYQEIRDKWNNLQRKAGLLDKYFADKGHYDANSTDIHSVRDISNLATYLIKYITKQSQNEKTLNGKVWDCSANLSKGKYYSIPLDASHKVFIEQAEENQLCVCYHAERYSIIKFKEPPEEYLLTKKQFKEYKTHIQLITNTIKTEKNIRKKNIKTTEGKNTT